MSEDAASAWVPQTLGWVLDKDTSTRRLHLYRVSAHVIGLAVEGPDDRRITLELDAEGLAALWNAVNQAAWEGV